MKRTTPRPSAAMIVALLALVVAMGGTSYAAITITGKNIKNGTVTGADLKNSSVTGADVRNGSLAANDFKSGALIAKSIPRKRVPAVDGIDTATARANAPRVTLYRNGALTVYGKCFTNTTSNNTYYETYIASSVAGSVFDSRNDSRVGGALASDFLSPTTLETDATLEEENVGPNDADVDAQDDSDFVAFAPDGTTLRGWTGGAVKNGTLAGGNGVYGPGNVCLFTGAIFGN